MSKRGKGRDSTNSDQIRGNSLNNMMEGGMSRNQVGRGGREGERTGFRQGIGLSKERSSAVMLHPTLDSNNTGARLAQNTVVSKGTDMFLQGERDKAQLVSGQDLPFENDWIRDSQHRIPKGPKADVRKNLRQDTPIENDWIKENQHLIPTGPKAHTSAESRQAGFPRELYADVAKRGNIRRFPTRKSIRRNQKDARGMMKATKYVRSSLSNFADVDSIHPDIDRPSYDRDEGYKSRNDEARVHGNGDVMTLQTTRPRHEASLHRRSRSLEQERESQNPFPSPSPSRKARVRTPPVSRQPRPLITAVRQTKKEACSTNPTERVFRKVAASSLSTPPGSSQSNEGNLYDPNKTEEQKEKIRREIEEHNRGLGFQWFGTCLDAEMRESQRD
jgi:hypothetical protein